MTGSVEVTVRRDIKASCELVYEAWITPDEASKFLFATEGGTIVRCEIDARVGGRFLITDRRADGDADHHGKFLELDRPRRIAFLFRGPDTEEGEWSTVTIDLVEIPTGCRLTLAHEIPEKWASYAEPVRKGWTMIIDSFARQMETKNG